MSDSITVKAYGKLNLLLDIVGKRPDGYHTLKSVFQSVSVYDTLEIEKTDGEEIVIECDDENVPTDESNLVYKACKRFFEETGTSPFGVKINIEKRIPAMAGMAGGSADCAATLAALNIISDAGLPIEKLCDIGEKLGADVPFCLTGGTVLCEGIGEIMTELPDFEGCYFAVAKPDLSISTPECYRKFDSLTVTEKPKTDDMIASLVVGDVKSVSECLYNALELAADFDEIKNIKNIMLENDAMGALMTGSGSAVFGIFENKRNAKDCIRELEEICPFTAVLKPVSAGLEIID